MRASRAVFSLLSFLAAGCTSREGAPGATNGFVVFTDTVGSSGIAFRHDNGHDGTRFRIAETITGGVALLDFDGDGALDIYFTNGQKIDPGPKPARNALYRGRGDGTFEDVSARSGTDDPSHSLGCSVADIDGDGDPDFLVTNFGPNRLYRNNGDGTFTDIAPAAGIAGDALHTGSAFLDMDHDGDLDLYIAAYAVDARKDHAPCLVRGYKGYCAPKDYTPAPHHLYENLGDGSFRDVSVASGIRAGEPGRGLGVIAADFDADGNPDLYVANDTTANYMFLGDGKGRFTEAALLNGTAFGEEGGEMGSMGVDAADYDGDGLLDIAVTNYQNQMNNLFRAVAGGRLYEERARLTGIAKGGQAEVAWGVGLVDLDNDGWRDLFVANGHLNPDVRSWDDSTSYEQRKKLFRNIGGKLFEDYADRAGEAMERPRVARGAAFGDLDNDGDIDIVINPSVGAPEVLRNDGGERAAWCFVRLVGSGKNRDAIGARVAITAGGRSQWAERRSSSSYLSVNDPRLHFGLGAATGIDQLEVRWPSGKVETHRNLPANRLVTVREGQTGVEAAELRRN